MIERESAARLNFKSLVGPWGGTRKIGNGNVHANVDTNNSECEGPTHENIGVSRQKGPETSPELRHEHCQENFITIGKKSIHHHRGTPLFSVCRPTPRSQSKKSYGVYHFPVKTREKGIHHRSGKKGIHHRASDPEKEKRGVSTVVVYTFPWWTFRIFFIFFLLGGGEGGVRGAGKGRGCDFLLKIPGRVVLWGGCGRGGRGWEGVCGEFGGRA